MRIAIDARMMGAQATRGIGRYIEELVRAMLEIAAEHRYVLVTRKASHPFASHPSVQTVVADTPWYGIAEQIQMPAILRRTRAEIIHIPHWNVPLAYHGQCVVTIHDLLLRHEPASAKISTRNPLTRTLMRIGYRLTLDHAISAARKILVPTQFVADDIQHLYPHAASKIVVTGEGMPGGEVRSLNLEARGQIPASSFQLPASFLLYVGSAYPHKGLEDLLAAWEGIAHTHPSLHLILAGEMDVFMRRVQEIATNKKLPRVAFLGRVSDDELANLYSHATAFVYPSHFEGFGLPPLEALSNGCPVISSDAGALREALGPDGASFFRRGDANDILRAVTEALKDPERQRARARSAASVLGERHTWRHTAARTLAAYRDRMT